MVLTLTSTHLLQPAVHLLAMHRINSVKKQLHLGSQARHGDPSRCDLAPRKSKLHHNAHVLLVNLHQYPLNLPESDHDKQCGNMGPKKK